MEECDGIFDLTCNLVSSASNAMVDMLRAGAEWVVTTSFGWWVRVDPVSIVGSSAVTEIRRYLLPLALLVAVAGMMWQGIRMAASRKPTPLIDAGRGLLMLAIFSSLGVVLADRAIRAADGFANWVLDNAAGGEGIDRLSTVLALQTIANPGAVMILSLFVIVCGLAQAMVMMLREAALIVLTGVVVFAAAGQTMGATRPWLSKVLGWSLALVFYKPVAALVYAAALALMGETDDPRAAMVGVMMMVLSLVALPALMRFFSWAVPAGTGGGGGAGTAMLGAAGAAAATVGYAASQRPGSLEAALAQERHIRNDLAPPAARGPAPDWGAQGAVGAAAAPASPAAGGIGGVSGRAGATTASTALSAGAAAKNAADGAASSLANEPREGS